MEQSKKLSTLKIILSVLNILLCITAVVGCCFLLFGNDEIMRAVAATTIVSLIFNAVYTLRGFSKKDFASFRISMLLSAVVSITMLASACADPANTCGESLAVFAGVLALQFASLVTLTLGKDLGGTVSSVLCEFVVLVPLYLLVTSFQSGNYDILAYLGLLASALSSALLVAAKYLDKYERKKAAEQHADLPADQ